MSALTNSWENARIWWQTATPATRAAATATVLLLVVGLIVAVSLAASPDYAVIYRGVSGKDADSIQKVLLGHNIKAVYSSDDQSISVPSKDKSNAIMYAEAEATLSKDVEIEGLELDKINIGTSSEVEHERIRLSNQQEIQHIIDGLEPVQSSSVKITQGDGSSLFGDSIPPTATVSVALKPGETLDDGQVKGIVGIVVGSVSGLTAKNVALTDQTGTSLWGGDGPGPDRAVGDSEKVADLWRGKLQNLLDSTLGPRKVKITVDAELDFDQTQIDSVEHTPTTAGGSNTLPLSVHEQTETMSGGAAAPAAGGVAGSGANLNAPSYTSPVSGSGSGSNYKNTTTETNYVDNSRHTITQKTPGAIKKLTVAALVDSSVPASVAATIQRTLSTAIGATAGDTTRLVTVQQLPFDTSVEKIAQAQIASAQSHQLWGTVARAVAVVVVVLMLLLMLTRSGRRVGAPQLALAGEGAHIGLLDRGAAAAIDEAMLEERPLRIEDVLAEMPDVIPNRSRRRVHAPSIEEQPDLKLESVQDMILGNPQAVALLLKGWMAEESRVS